MPRAVNQLRKALHYRYDAFSTGLEAAGYKVTDTAGDVKPDDVLVIWNRYGAFDEIAKHFEHAGARVVVVENGPFGDLQPGKWFTLALSQVAMTGGKFPSGDASRWNSFGITLRPWQDHDHKTLIFAQRGIGNSSTASPAGWAESVQARFGGRIRRHPGNDAPQVPLEQDLKGVRQAITWSSAAAVQSLVYGYPVYYRHPAFIAAGACVPLAQFNDTPPRRDDLARLHAMHHISGAVWSVEEVINGTALRRLLA